MIAVKKENFIGNGRHKKTYKHPYNSKLCIKVPYGEGGAKDLEREIEYRKIREQKGLKSSLLPEYYGSIETSEGKGRIFEYVVNYDGSSCKTLEDYCDNEVEFKRHYKELVELTSRLKELLFKERMITMGIFPENIIIQKSGAGKVDVRLINDLGSGVLIPLEYHFDFFAKKKIARRWKGFLRDLYDAYPTQIMERFITEIH